MSAYMPPDERRHLDIKNMSTVRLKDSLKLNKYLLRTLGSTLSDKGKRLEDVIGVLSQELKRAEAEIEDLSSAISTLAFSGSDRRKPVKKKILKSLDSRLASVSPNSVGVQPVRREAETDRLTTEAEDEPRAEGNAEGGTGLQPGTTADQGANSLFKWRQKEYQGQMEQYQRRISGLGSRFKAKVRKPIPLISLEEGKELRKLEKERMMIHAEAEMKARLEQQMDTKYPNTPVSPASPSNAIDMTPLTNQREAEMQRTRDADSESDSESDSNLEFIQKTPERLEVARQSQERAMAIDIKHRSPTS